MKLNELQELDDKQLENIQPGAWITVLLAAIPSIISVLNPIVGLVKSSFSEKGELKTKDTNYKWENSPKNSAKGSTINEKFYLNF